MSYPVQDVVGALQTNRREFSDFFLSAQYAIPIAQRIQFEAVAVGESLDSKAFEKAIAYSIAHNFIDNLLEKIINFQLEDGSLTNLYIEHNSKGSQPNLQAITNSARGHSQPDKAFKGIMKNMRLTGKVHIEGDAKGSGVLIGPDLFLTAWHVTQSLFSPVELKPQPTNSLIIEFDNFNSFNDNSQTPNHSVLVKAATDWCVSHCPCHEVELKSEGAAPTSILLGHWDYTIIKLTKPIGFERSWVKLDKHAIVPPDDSQVYLFQHPMGQPLSYDSNRIVSPKPADPSIPAIRFLHDVNAMNGSSGGPCFDNDFTLFGIHQGRWAYALDGRVANCGIPIGRIIEDFTGKIQQLPPPEISEIPYWCLDHVNFEPVVGCESFQEILWDTVLSDKLKIIDIRGTAGSGKSFLTLFSLTVLSDNDHLKLVLNAESFAKMDVVSFVRCVFSAAGVPVPNIPDAESYNSTPAAWLRGLINETILPALELAARGRLVWIILKDLNKFSLEGKHLAEFTLLFLESVKQVSWLRFIVDGMPGSLPASIQDYSTSHRTRALSRDDFKLFLNKCCTEFGQSNSDFVAGATTFLYSCYEMDLNEGASNPFYRFKQMFKALLTQNLK